MFVFDWILLTRCQYEKAERLQQYARSSEDTYDDSQIPITISVLATDEPKPKPAIIEVLARKASTSSKITSLLCCSIEKIDVVFV